MKDAPAHALAAPTALGPTVTCNTLVWLREQSHEAGTRFSIVAEPQKPKEVDQHTADRWRMNGWLVEEPKAAPASEGG